MGGFLVPIAKTILKVTLEPISWESYNQPLNHFRFLPVIKNVGNLFLISVIILLTSFVIVLDC